MKNARIVSIGWWVAAASGCGGTSFYVRPGLAPALPSPVDALQARLILAGDAGEVRPPADPQQIETDHTFEAIRGDAARDPQHTTVVWLGDNVYPRGFPLAAAAGGAALPDCASHDGDPTREQAEGVLRRQIAASAPAALALFVPGNHDWDRSGPCGFPRVLAEEEFVEHAQPATGGTGPREVLLLPDGGCPGPTSRDFPEGQPVLRLVALNTEWLLRDAGPKGNLKPIRQCAHGLGLPETANEADVRAAFLKRLGEEVAGSGGRPVVLVSHHPVQTRGHHGGAGLTGVQAKLFPTSQDLRGKKNRRMVKEIVDTLAAVAQPPLLIAAAGHDHDLQVLELARGPRFQLVSGSASKATAVGQGRDTLFKHSGRGYLRVDFILREGRPLARVYALGVDERGPHQLWSGWLAGPQP